MVEVRTTADDTTAFVPGLFAQPGRWIVQQLMPDLPGHETEPLTVNVVDAATTIAAVARNASGAPPSNTLGAIGLRFADVAVVTNLAAAAGVNSADSSARPGQACRMK